ncbi:hypothetical protein BJX70DRAFT_359596 [Aspergillus crustosus]
MAEEYEYTYFRVPKNEDGLPRSAQQYKELRLSALKLSPSSFAATYDSEATLKDEYWRSRLAHVGSETFVCGARRISSSTASGSGSSENGTGNGKEEPLQWVAQLTLLGPRTKSQWALRPEEVALDTTPENEEERWQLLGLYTLPTHRGKGVARSLCDEAVRYLIEDRTGPKNVVVRLIVRGTMSGVIRFYEQMGYEEVDRAALAEAMIANGEGDLLPGDYRDQERLWVRSGFVLVKRVSRA